MNFTPLAEQVRPTSLDQFVGQNLLIQKNSFIQKAIIEDRIPSMILWGPPGSGKTTLAHIISQQTKSNFVKLSAVHSGKKDLQVIIERAKSYSNLGQKTILFIDEIHRWNKAQQDALLPWVENGTITLIGATTENPSFALNSALISRTRVLVLNHLTPENIKQIILTTIEYLHQNTSQKTTITNQAIDFLCQIANGDARMAINTIEACSQLTKNITSKKIKAILQKTHLQYDKNGEEHYNIISALHKSMRGGDPHASVYWLARMIEAGEDPLYIARRLVRFASEDIGLANNSALMIANNTFQACQNIGLPECNVNLAHCVIYLAKSPKSIIAYQAYNQAKHDTDQFGNLPVPLHLRNAPTTLMKNLDYGKDYKYTPLENSDNQTYFPDQLKYKKYF